MHKHKKKLHKKVSRIIIIDNGENCSQDGASIVKLSKTLCETQKLAAQLTHKQILHPNNSRTASRLRLITYTSLSSVSSSWEQILGIQFKQVPNKNNRIMEVEASKIEAKANPIATDN